VILRKRTAITRERGIEGEEKRWSEKQLAGENSNSWRGNGPGNRSGNKRGGGGLKTGL